MGRLNKGERRERGGGNELELRTAWMAKKTMMSYQLLGSVSYSVWQILILGGAFICQPE